ncbi:MAG TPA: hypothetical protein VEB87_03315 [Nitrososphaerales archaeon]|nr:hypothetical protein [Nitrososphaerales archaeon]
MPPAESGTTAPQGRPRRSRINIAVAAVTIAALLVIVSLFGIIPTGAHVLSGSNANCLLSPGSSTVASEPKPDYDVQEVMAFAQSYPRLEFGVTAIAQCDANGYGPAYLVNGLSNTGYWYQVGINWDWPLQKGGYVPGFGFVSEVWGTGGLTSSSASTPFSGTVNPNDTVELRLSFNGDAVVASARDLNTGASASASYPAYGATSFVGSQAQQSPSATRGYFTGLMTEWYHASPNYTGPEQEVTYSGATPITSATLGVTEWNFTTSVPVPVFSSVANGGIPIDFGKQPNQLQQFTLDGYWYQLQQFPLNGSLHSSDLGETIAANVSSRHAVPGSSSPSTAVQPCLSCLYCKYLLCGFTTIQQFTLPFMLSADAYEYVTGP